jgi:hypothetical protein
MRMFIEGSILQNSEVYEVDQKNHMVYKLD